MVSPKHEVLNVNIFHVGSGFSKKHLRISTQDNHDCTHGVSSAYFMYTRGIYLHLQKNYNGAYCNLTILWVYVSFVVVCVRHKNNKKRIHDTTICVLQFIYIYIYIYYNVKINT